MDVVLASSSPRRRELLRSLGVQFTVYPADLAELSVCTRPEDVAGDLAQQKAQAVAAHFPHAVVMASDTVVAARGELLGKPRSEAQNAEFIAQLSGRTHQVYTGVAVVSPLGHEVQVARSDVTFRPLSHAEVKYYAGSGEGLDKAGGYGIQGLGAALLARLEGEYTNVVGFPLSLVIALLRRQGVAVWGE